VETKRIERSISELETSVEPPELPRVPESLTNRIEIVDGSRTVIYVADVVKIQQGGYLQALVGYVALGRYNLLVKSRSERKIVSILPWRVEEKHIPYTEDKQAWSYMHPDQLTIFSSFSSNNSETNFRRTLAEGILRKFKIRVTPELIALAFDPIEQQLLEWQKKYEDVKKQREEIMTIRQGKDGW